MPKYNDFELDLQKVEVSSLNVIRLSVGYSYCECDSFATEPNTACLCPSSVEPCFVEY